MKNDRAPNTADATVKDPELSWEITLRELAAAKPDRPYASLQRIARALRHGDAGVPRPVRDHLAGVILGEIKPTGRPQKDWLERALFFDLIASKYARELAELEAAGARAPKTTAKERVAKEMGMSVSSVRDALGRRNGWEEE